MRAFIWVNQSLDNIGLINMCTFENPRVPYLYISHNELYIRLKGEFNIFMFISTRWPPPQSEVNLTVWRPLRQWVKRKHDTWMNPCSWWVGMIMQNMENLYPQHLWTQTRIWMKNRKKIMLLWKWKKNTKGKARRKHTMYWCKWQQYQMHGVKPFLL